MSHDPFYPQSSEQIEEIARSRRFIPDEVAGVVSQWSNTPMVDVIPTRYGARGFEFLLTKRREAPWAGQWFFGGSRILPGEIPTGALPRVCRQEFGFVPETGSTKFVLWQSICHPESVGGGPAYFTLSACYQVWPEYDQQLHLDTNQAEFRWFTPEAARELELSVYVQKAIESLHRDPVRSLTSML
jgi:ADP-ribose pyrophosphatase YjhB (NUDIX family)